MRAAGKIVAYLGAVVLVAALLAPPLFWAGTALGRAAPWDFLRPLAGMPVSRYFNRALLVGAVLLLVPFLRWLGVRRWSDLGLLPNPRRWRDLGLGFFLSAGGLALVAAGRLLLGSSALRAPIPWDNVAGALGTAVAVALIEETFFRGVLLGALRRELATGPAVGFLSAFFAVLHFLKPNPDPAAPVDWLAGFALLPRAFGQFADPLLLAGGLLTLFAVALVLALATVRSQSLFAAYGLHAGWVFALRAFAGSTVRTAEPSWWFGRDLTTGFVPVLLVAATGVLVLWRLRPRTGVVRIAAGIS